MKANKRLSKDASPDQPTFYRLAGAADRRDTTDGPPGLVAWPPLVEARFVERPNRFLVIADVQGRRIRVASRDPGRLEELLRPGARVLVAPAKEASRRTAATLCLVRKGAVWVSLVPTLANDLLEAALRSRPPSGLGRTRVLAREVPHGRSRFDFLLSLKGRPTLTEVKSVSLVRGRLALFPDAPTTRGARHLRELTELRQAGQPTLMVFVVQRPDADRVSPHRDRDPAFAEALEAAVEAGVRIRAYTSRVSPRGCRLDRRIPVLL
jgi:sugar fermentation stimulation protein A